MARNEIDTIDVGAIVALPIFVGFVYGVWSLTINIFGGFDFSQSLWTIGGADITPALLLTVAAIGWIYATNELDGSNYEQWQYGLIIAVLVAPLLYVFVPAVNDLINAHDVGRFIMWLGTAVGATFISYVE